MALFGNGLLSGQQPGMQQPMLPRVPWNQNPLVTSTALGLLGGRNINEGFANAAAAAPAGMAAKSNLQGFMLKRQEEEAAKAAQRAAWNAGMKWKSGMELSAEDQAALSGAPEIALKFMPEKPQMFRPLTDPEERAKFGIRPDDQGPYQVGPDNKVYAVGGGGTNVSIDNVGTIPQGYELTTDPETGAKRMQPIPGGPADTSVQDTNKRDNQVRKADIVLQDIDRTLEKIERIPSWTTGLGGDILKNVPGTGANDAARLIDSVKANIGFEQLNQMRSESKTGAALGSVQVVELQFLQSVMGSLEQSQSPEQLAFNLKRLKNAYLDIVHGPGNGPPREDLEGVGDDGWTEVEPGIRIREKP